MSSDYPPSQPGSEQTPGEGPPPQNPGAELPPPPPYPGQAPAPARATNWTPLIILLIVVVFLCFVGWAALTMASNQVNDVFSTMASSL